MIRIDADQTIILSRDDMAGVDKILELMNRRSRDPSKYTNQEATDFARRWVAIRDSEAGPD